MTMTGHADTSSTSTAVGAAKDVASRTAHETEALARDAWAHAQDVMGSAREQVRTQAVDQASRAAQGMRGWSTQLGALLDGRPDEAPRIGELLRTSRTQLSSWAERIERDGLDGVLDDVGRFARRRPAAFLALCAGAGFTLGRATKAAHAQAATSSPSTLSGSPAAIGYATRDPRAGAPAGAVPSIRGATPSTSGDAPPVLRSDAIGTRSDETPGMR